MKPPRLFLWIFLACLAAVVLVHATPPPAPVPEETPVVLLSITTTNLARLEPTYQFVIKGRPNVAGGEWRDIVAVPQTLAAITNIAVPRTNVVSMVFQLWERDPETGNEAGPFPGSVDVKRPLSSDPNWAGLNATKPQP